MSPLQTNPHARRAPGATGGRHRRDDAANDPRKPDDTLDEPREPDDTANDLHEPDGTVGDRFRAEGQTPRKERHTNRWKKRPWDFRSFSKRFLVICSTLAVLAGSGLTIAYIRTPVPTQPQNGATDEGSTVYYADGRTPVFRLGANREAVRHDQIPDHLRWAVLAAEDRGFYKGHGISPAGMFRALLKNASGGDTQGASTVTQQLARNYFQGLSRERSMGRKVKEIFTAVKLNQSRSKADILDLYLNTIYLGRQTFGVQAAARAYFDKDVWQLDIAQSAMIAAIIQRPTYFRTQGDDPPARALRQRWQYVINGMVTMGRLSRQDAARLTFPSTREEWRGIGLSGQSIHVKRRVLEELDQLGIPYESVVNGKLKVYTGLEERWMRYAEQAMRETARESQWPAQVRGGLVAVDRNGAIRAFYGGDPKRSQVDSVFNPVAQSASTFKPYVLAAALRRGANVWSNVSGHSPAKFAPDGRLTPLSAPGYLVNNDEHIGSLGRINLVEATAKSVNTGYVKMAFETGLDNVADTAQRLGVPASALKPYRRQVGMALGIADISAVNQAAGYAAFANGGKAVTPHLITKIVDGRGHRIPLPWDRPAPQVLHPDQAAQVSFALRATVDTGTGTGAALAGRPVAGKTGTSDNYRDAWFVGYVPQLAAAVVMSDTQNKTMRNLAGHQGTVSGETMAPIWRAFMEKVVRDLRPEQFPTPKFIGRIIDWYQEPLEKQQQQQPQQGQGQQPPQWQWQWQDQGRPPGQSPEAPRTQPPASPPPPSRPPTSQPPASQPPEQDLAAPGTTPPPPEKPQGSGDTDDEYTDDADGLD